MIGADGFLGGNVSRALASDVPVIELSSDADGDTLADAIGAAEVVVNCVQSWSPARRLRYRKTPSLFLQGMLAACQRARVRRIVHVSTADVYGGEHSSRIDEKATVRPAHAYEKLKLFEERWLLENAGDLDVVVLRPARVFGPGEDWILPRLMAAVAGGRARLPGGGRAGQTFVSAADVGRACLAASDRGKPGRAYLVGGFDGTWRDLVESAARAVGFAADIRGMPYDLAYVHALATETVTPEGGVVWPGVYGLDVLGKPHLCDDSRSRRELTWSPSVGSFEQEMPAMTPWLTSLPEIAAALSAAGTPATSPPGR